MADGVWYINDSAAVIDPADYVVNNVVTSRVRRAVRNYAATGNATSVTLWARAGARVSDYMLSVARAERSSAELPSDVSRPIPDPAPITPPAGNVPIPSGPPPYPYALPIYNSRDGVWFWVEVDVKAATGGSGSYPSLNSYPGSNVYPGS